MEIQSKAEFFRLWNLGVLGNRLQQFKNWRQAYASDSKSFGFREVASCGGGQHIVVGHADLRSTAEHWTRRRLKFCVGTAAPDGDSVLQGEVCIDREGRTGYLSVRSGLGMREAIAAGKLKTYGGSSVKVLLDEYMDPSSQDDLDQLLELYPDAVIEFCTYPYDIGILPYRNTIFWEVRNY